MIAVLLALAASAGQHELVVRFFGDQPGYTHIYQTSAACHKGRQAILDDYKQRMVESERSARAQGAVGFIPSSPPIAICIPL